MKAIYFEWDEGNETKNWSKHHVSKEECEEIFFREPFVLESSFQKEKRFYAYGETIKHRKLFVVFAIRKEKIRVISARDMSRKERGFYEKSKKNS